MAIKITWYGHASFQIAEEKIIYIDPWKFTDSPHDGTVILVSHSHFDHYSAEDIARAAAADSTLISSADVIAQHGSGRKIKPGENIQVAGMNITAVAAYNIKKKFHPRTNQWLGFIVEIQDKRIYYAGDTDFIPEMEELGAIDLALLPIGGTYTMNPSEAAQATASLAPRKVIPYHWGDIVGSRSDAESFIAKAAGDNCEAILLEGGDSVFL